MKRPYIIYPALTLSFVFIISKAAVQAQSTKDRKASAKLESMVAAIAHRNHPFRAQTIVPLSGPRLELTGYCDLQVRSGTVISFLPYMSRIYMPPLW